MGATVTYADTENRWHDTSKITLDKILQSLNDGGAFASGGNFSGSGSPEGVVTASPGATYVDTDSPGALYFKRIGTGNTGWV